MCKMYLTRHINYATISSVNEPIQQSCGGMENTTGNGFAAFHSLPAVFPNFHAEADADFHRCGWRQKSNGKTRFSYPLVSLTV